MPHDHWSNCYDRIYQLTYGGNYDQFTATTLQVIAGILPGGTVLDFGAGTGRLSIPLAERGYDEKMGARPLARVIQENIKKPLAEELLFGKLTKGGTVYVGVKDGALHLSFEEPAKPRLTGQKPPLLTAE